MGVARQDAEPAAIGPRMARHGVPTERDRSEGHLSAARAVRRGKAFLGIFVMVRHSAV